MGTMKRQRHFAYRKECEVFYEREARNLAERSGVEIEVEGHDAFKIVDGKREHLTTHHEPWYMTWYALKHGLPRYRNLHV